MLARAAAHRTKRRRATQCAVHAEPFANVPAIGGRIVPPMSEHARAPASRPTRGPRRRRRAAARLLRDPPRPVDPRPAGRVRDVRPPRLGVPGRVQRGPHPRDDRGDLPLPGRAGYDGPLFIGRDTHALSEPALADGARGARRERGRRPGRRRTTASRRRPRCRTRSSSRTAADVRPRRPRRRDRRHAVAQPARRRRLQVQPAQRRPGRHRRHRAGSRTRRTGSSRRRAPTASTASRACRSSGHAARPARTTSWATYVADLGNVIDMAAIAASGLRIGVDPMGGASVDYWAAIGERYGLDLTVTNDRGRPDVRVHDPRLGRQDPDGPVVAVRDGRAGRAARPVRPRPRQRRRRRPPRGRRPGRRAAEPEPLPGGGDRVPVRRRARRGAATSPSARRSSRRR